MPPLASVVRGPRLSCSTSYGISLVHAFGAVDRYDSRTSEKGVRIAVEGPRLGRRPLQGLTVTRRSLVG